MSQSATSADEPVSRLEQILCVERLMTMRQEAYRPLIAADLIEQRIADREGIVLRAALDTLRGAA